MTEASAGATAETIATYDAIAHGYAVRFAVADRPRQREAFCSMLDGAGAPVVLDAGCGPGLGCRRLIAAGVTAIGLDLSTGMLAEARTITDAPLLRSDLTSLPFRDRRLAGIWCDAALVHLSEAGVEVAVHEFARVVSPGGALFASVCTGEGAEWLEGPSGHRRWFEYHDGAGTWLSILARHS